MSNRRICEHVFGDGHRCGSPALSGDTHCYYHRRYKRDRVFGDPDYELPPVDDHRGLKLLMDDILRSSMTGRMQPQVFRTMLYSVRMARGILRDIQRQEREETNMP